MSEYKNITIKDFLVSGEEFSLARNPKYGFLETRPQPPLEKLSGYYDSSEYISHTDSEKGIIAFLYQKVKKHSLHKKVKLIAKSNLGTGTLLDIGAGTGEFIRAARDGGWKTSGVEPNKKARNFARAKNVDLQESLEAVAGQKFDVVTLWHVLEHLPDLENTVGKIENLVKRNGTLIIAVPNFNSFDARHYKNYWAAFDVPRHLWHFSRDSMQRIFSSEMELQEIRPLIYDSFYVSLLSEKYKTGNRFSIKAFFIGLWSNVSAWRSKEYSSLIYCFKNLK